MIVARWSLRAALSRARLVPACLFGHLLSVSIGAVPLGNYTSSAPPIHADSFSCILGRSDAIVAHADSPLDVNVYRSVYIVSAPIDCRR